MLVPRLKLDSSETPLWGFHGGLSRIPPQLAVQFHFHWSVRQIAAWIFILKGINVIN